MLEIVVGIVLVLSLFGNYHQQNRIESYQEEAEYWQETASQNRAEWEKVVEVNENNASAIIQLEQAIADCETRHDHILERVNNFKEVTAIKDAAIADLRIRLGSTDFRDCRVPDWVDFSTVTGGTN